MNMLTLVRRPLQLIKKEKEKKKKEMGKMLQVKMHLEHLKESESWMWHKGTQI